MKVLVTAIGGDIGNGIGRILRQSGLATRLIGCDIHADHLGAAVSDQCQVVPRVDAKSYEDSLLAIAKQHAIELIIPTSEPELRFFSKAGGKTAIGGIPLLTANQAALELGFHKLATARFLEQHGLPFPWTGPVSEGEPKQFPCIVKSRFGASSNDVRVVESAALADAYRKIHPAYIWQELVGAVEDEYTCGVYRSQSGETRVITIRRRLHAGITNYGVVIDSPDIERLCIAVADKMMLTGSINIQLRLTPRGPMVFEINPRFSSTVMFRHLLAFQDLIWSISDKMSGSVPPYASRPPAGVKIFRQTEEMIVSR